MTSTRLRVLDGATALWLRWRSRYGAPLPERAGVYFWRPDGSVTDVSPTPGSGFYALPSVRPDGASILYHGGDRERCRVWRWDAGSGVTTPLSPETLVACSPAYDAPGRRVVFSGYCASAYPDHPMRIAVKRYPGIGLYFGGAPHWMSLYCMADDGSGLRRLTEGTASDARPAWSADGRSVYFLRRRRPGRGVRGLWRLSLDGGEPEPLIEDRTVGRPAPAPDGSAVYFFTRVDGVNRLARIDPDGGPWEPLGRDTLGAWSHGPTCTPDGSEVWYHAGLEGGSLCRLRLDGGDPEAVTPPGFEERPVAHASVARSGAVAFDSVHPS